MTEADGSDSHYHAIKAAVVTSSIGGRHVTNYLMRLLGLPTEEDGVAWSRDFEAVQRAKEKYCYVAEDPSAPNDSAEFGDVEIPLPGGRTVTVTREMRWKAAEILFNPSMAKSGPKGESLLGLHELVFESAMRLKNAGQYQGWWFTYNTVVTGGTAAIPGLKQRLIKELKVLYAAAPREEDRHEPPKLCEYDTELSCPSWTGICSVLRLGLSDTDNRESWEVFTPAEPLSKLARMEAVVIGTCCVCRGHITAADDVARAEYLLVHRRCFVCATCGKAFVDPKECSVSRAAMGGQLLCGDHIGRGAQSGATAAGAAREVCVSCGKSVHAIERAKLPFACHRSCAKCSACSAWLRADNAFAVGSTLFCATHRPRARP